MQISVHEVVAHHHFHAHVVEDGAELLLKILLLLPNLLPDRRHRLLARAGGIVKVFQDVGDDFSMGPSLDEDLWGDKSRRHLWESDASLALEVFLEALEVEGFTLEVHLRLDDLVEIASVEGHGHVEEAFREFDHFPYNGQVHEGAVDNSWVLDLHGHVPEAASRPVQRILRAQLCPVNLPDRPTGHGLVLELVEKLFDVLPQLPSERAPGDLNGVGWSIRPKLCQHADDVWREHVWPHGEPLAKLLKGSSSILGALQHLLQPTIAPGLAVVEDKHQG
mmetsp:Transcript_68570/g.123574  ORF Transcript_68570/g.123574 Transcript_68570/m.123574 type:complete len:278 (+) Transcript_68570:281-1114(+)